MSSFDLVKQEAKRFIVENKLFFDRFSKDIENLTIGNYIDLYIASKGISSLNTGSEFDTDYDNALTNLSQKSTENHKQLVISFLDFLIWIKKKQDASITAIKEKKYLKKNALNYPMSINTIYSCNELKKSLEFEILLFYYCSLQEIFKNIVQEDLLLNLWKQNKTDMCDLRKKHIALGDFKQIIEKYEKECNIKSKISTIFDVELRNKILHADYIINDDKLLYGAESIRKDEFHLKIIELGIALQFFVLFCLRIFKKE